MSKSNIPVVIGAGLTGSLISLSLSKHGIEHVLVGAKPNDTMRPGESLNLLAPAGLRYLLGDSDSYYEKNTIRIYDVDREFTCNFDVSKMTVGAGMLTWFYKGLGYPPDNYLYHVDRISLDKEACEKATDSACCHHVSGNVKGLSYDEARDTITELYIDDMCIAPSHVFDATNNFALVPRQIGLHKEIQEEKTRLVFTHYCRHDDPGDEEFPYDGWVDDTHILLLEEEADGVDGKMWLIAMGRMMSMGITVDLDTIGTHSTEDIMRLAEAAAARRGLAFRPNYPEHAPAMDRPVHYHVYERCAGKNWMLSGTTAISAMWTTSSGVGMSVEAAYLAPHFIKRPQRVRKHMETSIGNLHRLHKVHEDFFGTHRRNISDMEYLRIADSLIQRNVVQTARNAYFSDRWASRQIARTVNWLFDIGVLKVTNYCTLRDGSRLSDLEAAS